MAPSNVRAFDPQTTTIRLSWDFENKVRDVLGILTGFRIFYQLANSSSAPIQRHDVGANKREANIAGLDIYRFYRISVAAKTRIDHGVISGDIYMRTLGTGLCTLLVIVSSFQKRYRRCGGLMVSALDFGSNGPGSSPGRGHCVVFLCKTLFSHGAFLHPGEQKSG